MSYTEKDTDSWISVSKSKPNTTEDVLLFRVPTKTMKYRCLLDYSIEVGYYDAYNKKWYVSFIDSEDFPRVMLAKGVTHWQPLPKPPNS